MIFTKNNKLLLSGFYLTLNPSPEGEGLKELNIRFLLPFSFRRRVPIAIGRGMR